MLCSNCHAELLPGAKFCIRCGAPVVAVQPVPTSPEPQPVPTSSSPPPLAAPLPTAQRSGSGVILAILAAVAIVLVGVAIVGTQAFGFHFGNGGPSTPASANGLGASSTQTPSGSTPQPSPYPSPYLTVTPQSHPSPTATHPAQPTPKPTPRPTPRPTPTPTPKPTYVDLQVTKLNLYSGQLCAGTSPTFRAYIRNNGTATSGDFNIRWVVDGSTNLDGGDPPVKPGQTVTYDHIWTGLTSGPHTLKFIANYGQLVQESTYSNNSLTISFTVASC